MKEYMDNYEDMSDERGFQFEFYCELCGHKHRTPYEKFTKGAVWEGVADRFSGIIGGVMGSRVEKMQRDALDDALKRAVDNVAAQGIFQRCGQCSSWACKECWVPQENSCKNCSVILQAEKQAQIVGQSAAAAVKAWKDPDGVGPAGGLICPQCQKPAGTGKFCQECGAPLGQAACPSCQSPMVPGAKFCGECGHKVG
jgi:hypothetical protein